MGGALLWTADVELAVLAWLDFCLQGGTNFKDSVVSHLYETKEIQLTLGGILEHLRQMLNRRSKLRGETRTESSNAASTASCLKDLLSKGSCCVPGISKANRVEITKLTGKYVATAGQSKRAMTSADSSRHPRMRIEFQQPSSHSPAIQFIDNPWKSSTARAPTSQHMNSITPVQKTWQIASEDDHEKYLTRLERSKANIQKLWEAEVKVLHDRLRLAEAREARLVTTNNQLNSISQTQEGLGIDGHNENLLNLNLECQALGKELRGLRQSVEFIGSITLDTPFGRMEVDKYIDNIAIELEALSCECEIVHSLGLSTLSIEHELRPLMCTTSATGKEDRDLVTKLRTVQAKFGTTLLVKWFTISALQNWVFLTDFPNFSEGSTQLLQPYRKVVEEFVGWEKERDLELAVIHRVINEIVFTESLIPNRAAVLATQLCQTLNMIFNKNNGGEPNNSHQMFGKQQEENESMKSQLQRIFTTALKFKANSILCRNKFVWVIHEPGTRTLDPRISVSFDGQDGSPMDIGRLAESRSWLHATLMVYQPRSNSHMKEAAHSGVCSRNFIPITEVIGRMKLGYEKALSTKDIDRRTGCRGPEPHENTVEFQSNEGHRKELVEIDERTAGEKRSAIGNESSIVRQQISSTTLRTSQQEFAIADSDDSTASEDTVYAPSEILEVSGENTSQQAATSTGGKLHSSACPTCKKTFSKNGNLKQHIEAKACRYCVHCDESFKRSKNFWAHFRDKKHDHKDVGIKCKRCGQNFDTSNGLKQHLKKNVCVQCPQCQEWLPSQAASRSHETNACNKTPAMRSPALKRARSIGDTVDSPPLGKRPSNSRRNSNPTQQAGHETHRTKGGREMVTPSSDSEEGFLGQALFPGLVANHKTIKGSRLESVATTEPLSMDPKQTTSLNTHVMLTNDISKDSEKHIRPRGPEGTTKELELLPQESRKDSANINTTESSELSWDGVNDLDEMDIMDFLETRIPGTDVGDHCDALDTEKPAGGALEGPASQSDSSWRPFDSHDQL